jgi:hypothetical protein
MKDTLEVRINGHTVTLEEGDTLLQHSFAVEEEAGELYREISEKVRRMVGGIK